MGQLDKLASTAEQEQLAQGGAATAATLKQAPPSLLYWLEPRLCICLQPTYAALRRRHSLSARLYEDLGWPAANRTGSPGARKTAIDVSIDVINFGTSQKSDRESFSGMILNWQGADVIKQTPDHIEVCQTAIDQVQESQKQKWAGIKRHMKNVPPRQHNVTASCFYEKGFRLKPSERFTRNWEQKPHKAIQVLKCDEKTNKGHETNQLTAN